MIEIQIAGAGAGKTYGLAELITKRIKESKDLKKIYALTYTNFAKERIEQEIMNHNKEFPEQLTVSTVHNFLLNEIIYPYSDYMHKIPYSKCSISYLGADVRYKARKIKALKDKQIIHAEKVYEISKQVLDNTTSKNKSKKQKRKIGYILSLLEDCIDSIYVDEVQDLDLDALKTFEIIGLTKIFVYLIGDPKQAIKKASDFVDFIEAYQMKPKEFVKILEINNFTRRVPENILKHSNRFCYKRQEQENINKAKGCICYITSENDSFSEIIKKHNNSDSIVCIDKKNSYYSTNENIKCSFPPNIEEKIIRANRTKNNKLLLNAEYSSFQELSQSGRTVPINYLIKKFNLNLTKSDFAQLYELYEYIHSPVSEITISSIDSIKGLEADTCIFILTPNTFNYLIQEDLNENQCFNKEWKKIYVALTRARKNCILALDQRLFETKVRDLVSKLEKLGIKELSFEI